MRLDIRKQHQVRMCKEATITFNGIRQTQCVVADEEQGYIEVQIGTRSVGIGKESKPILRRTYGKVVITIPAQFIVTPRKHGKVTAIRHMMVGTVTHPIPAPQGSASTTGTTSDYTTPAPSSTIKR